MVNLEKINCDAVVGIESRGFLFGFLLANRLKVVYSNQESWKTSR